VLLNQMSESISDDFRIGADIKPKTPGGRRMEFECLYRINLESKALRDNQEHELYKYKPQYGLEMFFNILKNRYSPIRGCRKVITQIDFDLSDYNKAHEVLIAAVYLDIVERRGNYFVFKKGDHTKSILGKEAAITWLASKPGFMLNLVKQITPRHSELHKNKKDERLLLKAKNQLDQMAMDEGDDIWGDEAA
jgi:hypothetical protein